MRQRASRRLVTIAGAALFGMGWRFDAAGWPTAVG
jgi:hypothetical protein